MEVAPHFKLLTLLTLFTLLTWFTLFLETREHGGNTAWSSAV